MPPGPGPAAPYWPPLVPLHSGGTPTPPIPPVCAVLSPPPADTLKPTVPGPPAAATGIPAPPPTPPSPRPAKPEPPPPPAPASSTGVLKSDPRPPQRHRHRHRHSHRRGYRQRPDRHPGRRRHPISGSRQSGPSGLQTPSPSPRLLPLGTVGATGATRRAGGLDLDRTDPHRNRPRCATLRRERDRRRTVGGRTRRTHPQRCTRRHRPQPQTGRRHSGPTPRMTTGVHDRPPRVHITSPDALRPAHRRFSRCSIGYLCDITAPIFSPGLPRAIDPLGCVRDVRAGRQRGTGAAPRAGRPSEQQTVRNYALNGVAVCSVSDT